jgi:hypothetical protein
VYIHESLSYYSCPSREKPIEGKIAWFFSDKMEAEQVFIKTEGEYEEERDVATQFLPEETPCPEPVKSER